MALKDLNLQPKLYPMEKVVVGMSGGIDSTLTALKLKDRGFEVIGVTLLMWDSPASQKAIEDAQLQAKTIGVEHHVVCCQADFKSKVVNHFISSYLNGETPSPCAWCNPQIKWKYIADFADSIGVHHISSGHYIEVAQHDEHHYVCKGIDPQKDQSYYLWMLPESIVRRMIQPLGNTTKIQNKTEMVERNFEELIPNRESMSVCFLSGTDYRQFLFEHAPDKMSQVAGGDVLDEQGLKIGTHVGFPFYTIGQKRGLTLDVEREAYVSKMDRATNSITVARKKDLLTHEFLVKDLHFINQNEITPSTRLEVKVRGLGLNPEGAGSLRFMGDRAKVTLEQPAWAMSPGQPVVFYIDNRLVGGGISL